MQNKTHTKYALTAFIVSLLACSTVFPMEEGLQELQRVYFECKNNCKQTGKHHNSPLYGAVVRPDYACCAKTCQREFKTNSLLLKMEQHKSMRAGDLLLCAEQSKNQ
jgi:hypothetical protein